MIILIIAIIIFAILLSAGIYYWIEEKDTKKAGALLALALLAGAGGFAGEDIVSPDLPTYTISGNTVFINDSKAFLSATPYLLTQDGWVEVELGTKQFTGDVNVLVGFNTTQVVPKKLERLTTITETYEIFNNDTNEMEYYNYTYDSWAEVLVNPNSINFNYDGKNKWFYFLNIPLEAGVNKKYRMYLNIDESVDIKYDIAAYPSSYGTTLSGLSNAVSAGNLFLLDPWVETSEAEGGLNYPFIWTDDFSGTTLNGNYTVRNFKWYTPALGPTATGNSINYQVGGYPNSINFSGTGGSNYGYGDQFMLENAALNLSFPCNITFEFELDEYLIYASNNYYSAVWAYPLGIYADASNSWHLCAAPGAGTSLQFGETTDKAGSELDCHNLTVASDTANTIIPNLKVVRNVTGSNEVYLFINNSYVRTFSDMFEGAGKMCYFSFGTSTRDAAKYIYTPTRMTNLTVKVGEIIHNTEPNITSAALIYDNPYAGTAVRLYCGVEDDDGDKINITYNIYRNSTSIATGVTPFYNNGTNVSVYNFTASEGYVYIGQCLPTDNQSLSGDAVNSSATEQFLGLTDANLCSGILSFEFYTNISRGTYYPLTQTYNEQNILPRNNSVCGYTYLLNNSIGISLDYTFTTNYTNPNTTLRVDNLSFPETFTLSAGELKYVNVTYSYDNISLLYTEQPFTIDVGVAET